MLVLRAADRGRSEQPGIRSWHCFSSGPYYDPDNVSFGPLVGVDQHAVAPRAGFDWHSHRGVQIVSSVLAGTLRHEDVAGPVRYMSPGSVLVQSAGPGIRHREANPSDVEELHLVQTTLVSDAAPHVEVVALPVVLGAVIVDLHRSADFEPGALRHVFVASGEFRTAPGSAFRAGDSVRLCPKDSFRAEGNGELLVVSVEG